MSKEGERREIMKKILILSVLAVILSLSAQVSWAQIPQTMSYQGLLTDNSDTPLNGTYSMMFSLYGTEIGGAPLWTETHPSVSVVKGIFNVILGGATPPTPLTLPFDQQYWLGITIGAGPELSSRTKLTSSPYSLNAGNVSDGAVTTAKLVDNAVTSAKIQPDVVSSVDGVSNDGGNIDLVPGSNIIITPNDSANTITISAASDDAWKLTGNSGTDSTTDFLGTTDDRSLVLRVNGERALRLSPNVTSPNIIGGYSGNTVGRGVVGVTISGGGRESHPNTVYASFGTVSGGYGNTASGHSATVGGGRYNEARGKYATIGGGGPLLDLPDYHNRVTDDHGTIGGGGNNQAGNDNTDTTDAEYATVGGGCSNTASGNFGATVGGGHLNEATASDATVGGGYNNEATARSSTIPGGYSNEANGAYSFAAGRWANAEHDGCFVWSDSSENQYSGPAFFASAAVNEFAVRCTGGARFVTQVDGDGNPILWTYLNPATGYWEKWTASDRNLKVNLAAVDGRDVLERLASIPIETWSYKAQDPPVRHIGPMAQDFHKAFGLGADDRSIDSMDADGVALAAIQGLYEVVKEKDAQIATQQEQIVALEARLAALEKLVSGSK